MAVKGPYVGPLLLQIAVWEVELEGARSGRNVHDWGAWERAGGVCFAGGWPVRPRLEFCLFHR